MELSTLFPSGLDVRVRTGQHSEGKHVVGLIPTKPAGWSADFARLVIESGCRAVVAEKLNTTPTDDGQKYRAAKALFAQADAGAFPDACRAVRRGGGVGAKPKGDEALTTVVNEVIAAMVAGLAKVAEKINATGSGKHGNMVAADWPKLAAKVGATKAFVTNDAWDMTKLIDYVKANKAERLTEVRKEIAEREAKLATIDDDIDLDTVEIDF